MMRKLCLLPPAVAAILLSLSGVVVSAAPQPTPGTLFLHPAAVDLGGAELHHAERGVLFVPLRRDAPARGVLGIEIYRFRSRSNDSMEHPPVFLLHGGPGWPGLGDSFEDAGYWESRVRPVTAFADLVLIGQRGIGSSKPDTICAAPPASPPDVATDPEKVADTWRATSERCMSFWREHLDLDGFNVLEAAADVDDVRRALGYEKIVLWGGSFGSHWSMALMHRYPEIVERALLRGLEGPDHTYDMPSEVVAGLERIAAAVEADATLRPLLPKEGLLEAFRGVVTRAGRAPIEVEVRDPVTAAPITVRFGAEDIREMAMGYTSSARSRRRAARWPSEMLELIAGDFRGAALTRLRFGESGFPTASFFMLDCGSGISRARAAELAADPAVGTVGRLGDFYDANCPVWGSDLGESFRRNVETSIPTVLVHGDWDLSTPYENAVELAPFFTDSRFVTVRGGSHGALREAMAHDATFRAAILDFLATGDLSDVPEVVEMPPIAWTVPKRDEQTHHAELLATAHRYLYAMYTESDFKALASFYTEESLWEDPTMDYFKDENGHGETRRYEGGKAIVDFYRWANQDGETEVDLEIESSFVVGDRVILNILYHTRADGALVGYPGVELDGSNRGLTILTIRDGKVLHHLDHVDYPDMMRQVREQARKAESQREAGSR